MTNRNNGSVPKGPLPVQYSGGSRPGSSPPFPGEDRPPRYNPPRYQPVQGMAPPAGYLQKSRVAAGLLAFFLGSLGIHCFYLGNSSGGLVRLLISVLLPFFGPCIMLILGVRDGVRLLDGRTLTDAYGFFLKP